MTTFDKTGKPPWALTIWSDYEFIYLEVPVKDGPPYIQKFSHSEGGLSKALAMIRDCRKAAEPIAKNGSRHDESKLIKRVEPKQVLKDPQRRSIVREVLRRLKI